ncbi:MAG: hypothetical protein ACI8PB_004617 [Desulforhopalus sp.]|jgi:hypothetical protein
MKNEGKVLVSYRAVSTSSGGAASVSIAGKLPSKPISLERIVATDNIAMAWKKVKPLEVETDLHTELAAEKERLKEADNGYHPYQLSLRKVQPLQPTYILATTNNLLPSTQRSMRRHIQLRREIVRGWDERQTRG